MHNNRLYSSGDLGSRPRFVSVQGGWIRYLGGLVIRRADLPGRNTPSFARILFRYDVSKRDLRL